MFFCSAFPCGRAIKALLGKACKGSDCVGTGLCTVLISFGTSLSEGMCLAATSEKRKFDRLLRRGSGLTDSSEEVKVYKLLRRGELLTVSSEEVHRSHMHWVFALLKVIYKRVCM